MTDLDTRDTPAAADVFISYSRRDSDFVRGLADALQARGKSVWLDVEGIADGEVFPVALQRAIESSAGFVFVISPQSATSRHCVQEVDLALELNKRIVPIVHEPVPDDALPHGIRVRNWIPGDDPTAAERVRTALDYDLAHVKEHTRWGLKALEWDQRGRDGALLLRGSELTAAAQWLAGTARKDPQPTELQREYVRAALRSARRRRRALIGMSVAAALAVLAALVLVIALISSSQASEERELASTSRQLAAQASAHLGTDPQLSLLLATQAVRTSDTPEAVQTLRDVLERSPARSPLPPLGDQSCSGGSLIAYSPDGSTLALGSCDGTVRLVDPTTGKVVRSAQVARLALNPVYAPDGKTLFVGAPDGVLGLDPETLEVERRHPAKLIRSNDVAAGAAYVAAVQRADDEKGWVWDRTSGRRVELELDPDAGYPVSVAVVGDRVLVSLLTPAREKLPQVLELDARTGRRLRAVRSRDAGGSIAVAPDQRSFVVAAGGAVARWSLSTLTRREVFRDDEATWQHAAYSRDGRRLLLGGTQQSVIIPAGGGAVELRIPGSDRPTKGSDFAPDGRGVATVDGTGEAALWGTDSLTTEVGQVARDVVQVAAAGDAVLASTQGGTLSTIDARGRVSVEPVPGAVRNNTAYPDIDPWGRYVVGDDGPRSVFTRRATGERVARTVIGADDIHISRIAFHRDGGRAVIFGGPPEGSAPPRLVELPRGRVTALPGKATACPWNDGVMAGRYAIGVTACKVFIWDVTSGRALGEVQHKTGGGRAAGAPDGRHVAIAADSHVIVAELPSGRVVEQLEANPVAIGFSPDSRWLVTVGSDGQMTVFDARTWAVVRRSRIDNDAYHAQPTATGVLVAYSDGRIHRYPLCPACGDVATLLRQAEAAAVRDLTDAERRTYLGAQSR